MRLDAELAVGDARRDDDRARLDVAAVGAQQVVRALGPGLERGDLPAGEELHAEADRLVAGALGQPHAGDPAREAEVVADHRARAGLPADRLGLEHDRGEALAGAVHRGGEAGRAGADDRQVDDAVDLEVAGRAVDRHRDLAHRGRGDRGRSMAPTSGQVTVPPAASKRVDHLLALGGVGRVDAGRHAHPLGVLADRAGQRHARRRHDAHGLDLGRGDGRAPVGQHLGDRAVELLVAHAARHQQVGVVLALGQARTQLGGLRQEPSYGAAMTRRAVGTFVAPVRERLQRVGVGQVAVLHEQRDGAALGLRRSRIDLDRLGARAGGAQS